MACHFKIKKDGIFRKEDVFLFCGENYYLWKFLQIPTSKLLRIFFDCNKI